MPDDQKVHLYGHIDVPLDRLEAVKQALPNHIRSTRAEAGCISFSVVPNPDIAGRFVVAESFINQAAFEAHQERTKSSPWFAVTQGIPREYSITTESEKG